MDFEGSCIMELLEQKSILVTGPSGFLGKIFIEKVLKEQPNVKKLFLLIRAADPKAAAQRLQDMTEKELFSVLKRKHGSDFDSFIAARVRPVVGDISCEHLGVADSAEREEMWDEVDVIVNVAATTRFDERYDHSLKVNTLGAKHALDFAKKCRRLEMFLHVSTAFVWMGREGVIPEKALQMGESMNGRMGLSVEEEMAKVESRLAELAERNATEGEKTLVMKELGLERARLFGWPNTYVYTKAMGEMLLSEMRGDVPLIIVRPSIVSSTFKEPFPGWIEGLRTIDSFIVGFAKGNLRCLLADMSLTMDVIPADMVVNVMIMTLLTHLNQQSQFIYVINSSVRNPVQYSLLETMSYKYFSQNPCKDKDGNLINVRKLKVYPSPDSFDKYLTRRYKFPLKCLGILNEVTCKLLNPMYTELQRKLNFIMRIIDLHGAFMFFRGREHG